MTAERRRWRSYIVAVRHPADRRFGGPLRVIIERPGWRQVRSGSPGTEYPILSFYPRSSGRARRSDY